MSLTAYAYRGSACQDSRMKYFGSAHFLEIELVSYSSKKQRSMANINYKRLNYNAMSGCCAQIHWIAIPAQNYGFDFNIIPCTVITKSAIAHIILTKGLTKKNGSKFSSTPRHEEFEPLKLSNRLQEGEDY
ncbi:hypothetical protein Tco_1371006 [Tanacetum coccineum]